MLFKERQSNPRQSTGAPLPLADSPIAFCDRMQSHGVTMRAAMQELHSFIANFCGLPYGITVCQCDPSSASEQRLRRKCGGSRKRSTSCYAFNGLEHSRLLLKKFVAFLPAVKRCRHVQRPAECNRRCEHGRSADQGLTGACLFDDQPVVLAIFGHSGKFRERRQIVVLVALKIAGAA